VDKAEYDQMLDQIDGAMKALSQVGHLSLREIERLDDLTFIGRSPTSAVVITGVTPD
jgi:hypothetical protein